MGRYIHVAGINLGPCVLKHKYHRHWNHGRPRVGFGGILGVPSIEPLLGGGVRLEGSIDPPPPKLTVLVTVGLPPPLPLSGSVFLLSVFCTMNLFTPNKSASPPKDSDNRGVEPSVGPSPSSQTNPDLEALVRQQAAELEGLHRRLEKAELASPKTPRLTTEALAEFRGRERLAGWMKQTAESLEQYVQQVPRADMEGTEDLTPGEVLANRVWDTLWDSHKAYEGRQRAREDAESAEGKQLDALQWSQASAHPTDSFRWRGVRFVREGGVLKWVNASGRKVPLSAPAPGECRRCKAHSPKTTAPKHWHFQCPHWA